MECIACNINPICEYEEIGEGKHCQSCLDREISIWAEESGFKNEEWGL